MLKKFLLGIILLLVAGGGAYIYLLNRPGPDLAALEAAYMKPADSFVDVGGLKVRVRDEGPRDAPVIVLMHGFIYSLETWDAWASELSKTYRVVRFDLAGHGLTGPDPKERYSAEERAAFVGEVLDALGIEHAVVGGNSLGGLAAWKFAVLAPDRVDALILVSAAGYQVNGVSDEPVEPPAAMKIFLKTAPAAGVEATLKKIFSDDSYVTPYRMDLLGDMMRRDGNGDAYIASIAEFTLPDPAKDLSSITAPTLIIWGEDDLVLPLDHGTRLHEAIAGSQLVIYPGVGHVPQEEAAEESVEVVIDFLRGLDLEAP
ncbi:MAG: alpha/beta fold hydrolase [Parvularculaceae bacterium]|nr:alpha/beta fold hydrolase [Parvularculaceae bacterium]